MFTWYRFNNDLAFQQYTLVIASQDLVQSFANFDTVYYLLFNTEKDFPTSRPPC
jgi:hypothetical protein